MDWRDVARQQAGTIDRTQFARYGVTEDEVRGMVRRGDLIELLPCVYSPRSVPDSTNQRDWGAVLWSAGVLSHYSAAWYWHLPVAAPGCPHVTVSDRRFRGRVADVRVHRVRLPEQDVTSYFGLPTTNRQRTVLDLLRVEPYGRARDLRDRALQRGWIGADTITRSVQEQPGRTGNRQLRLLVQEVVVGAQAESERLLHRILRDAGMTGWRAQYPVWLNGKRRDLDVAFPDLKIAIEVDGRLAHDGLSDRFDDDRARQNDLVAAGWVVLRFTWRHLQDPHYVISRITQLLAA